jgi:hypothetical protein
MAKKTSCTNNNLHKAKNAKDDEFFTKLSDIENELRNYKHHFNGKVVLCNCDESEHTNFYKYFELNFIALNLKKLICVGYRTNRVAEVHVLERVADYRVNEYNVPLKGHGDFRDQESINFLKEADIVVTNPPFSLFREFVAQLVEYDKKFLIIGNKNAISYKEIFPLIKNNKLWLGCTVPTEFTRPDGSINKLGTLTRWFTNLDTAKRHEILFTGVTYERGMNKGLYQKYDNYDAINVDKVKDIPTDYEGVMGVPITYLDRHNPDQFEIIKFRKGDDDKDLAINGHVPYFRILIKKITEQK